MMKRAQIKPRNGLQNLIRGAIPLTTLFIAIEFFDELHYGVETAILPALRADLNIDYAQIGLLLGLPGLISTLIEPIFMLLGDTRWRKSLILGGGAAIAIAMLLIATGASFPVILAAFALGYPASGAFVTLSQGKLMEAHPGREAQMMARWTLAGSAANLFGPLLIAAGFWLGFGWRWAYVVLAALALLLATGVQLARFTGNRPGATARQTSQGEPKSEISTLLKGLLELAHDRRLWSWIVLLQLSDLMLDVFTGYLPLYLTDLAGLSNAETGLTFGAFMVAGLVGDAASIPLLERYSGRSVVRALAAFSSLGYVVWLVLPWSPLKLVLLMVLRFSTLGWYPVLQGEAYAVAPGKSGSVLALGTAGGVIGSGLAWLVGWIASQAGLPAAMWLLLLGPISLALFVPKREKG
jgi:FSR family fosmidomycin resistance protein-like MFS transporter